MAKKTPRISINKLGEYCEANSTRRKQIVADAKKPVAFKTTRYADVREAIKSFFLRDMDYDIIDSTLGLISDKKPASPYQLSDQESSIEALRLLMDSDLTTLEGFGYIPFENDHTHLTIAGVDVSVYPDLLLVRRLGEEEHIGAIKIHITKEKLEQESQKIIAAVLYKYVSEFIVKGSQIADLSMCFSFDIFSEQIESSPGSYKRRMQRVETACEEIALWWDKL